MIYQCYQRQIVIEDEEDCIQAFEEHIVQPGIRYIGVDCEWTPDRPVALLQVATPCVVLLVRLSKMDFQLPEIVKNVLKNRKIVKVGVNIDGDSKKLLDDCVCPINGWLDLRCAAIKRKTYGRVLAEKIKNYDYDIDIEFDKNDPKQAFEGHLKKHCWCPKMGLDSLVNDVLGEEMRKSSHDRWMDDWEAETLTKSKLDYAANDAASGLEIFTALAICDVLGDRVDITDGFTEEMYEHMDELATRLADIPFLQKIDEKKCYAMIASVDKSINLYPYLNKPKGSSKKQSLSSLQKKEFYKRKAREAKEAAANGGVTITNGDGANGHGANGGDGANGDGGDDGGDGANGGGANGDGGDDGGDDGDGANGGEPVSCHKEKVPRYNVSTKPMYENCKLYAPDGELLCTCDSKKIEWYINKEPQIAVRVETGEGEASAARLLFEPSGRPEGDRDYYTLEKDNKCCSCGREEELVRKNVVPKTYRKHLPKSYKDHQCHDVVLLCTQCHRCSDIYDNIMRDNLATDYSAPLRPVTVTKDKELEKVKSSAKALTSSHAIPEERRGVLRTVCTHHLGHQPSQEELVLLAGMDTALPSAATVDHGTAVMKQVLEAQQEVEFVLKWRKFFVKMLEPQHLPKGWDIGHRVQCNNHSEERGERGEDVVSGGPEEGEVVDSGGQTGEKPAGVSPPPHTGEKPFSESAPPRQGTVEREDEGLRAENTGENPYLCDQCQFVAVNKVSLSDHMQTHVNLDVSMSSHYSTKSQPETENPSRPSFVSFGRGYSDKPVSFGRGYSARPPTQLADPDKTPTNTSALFIPAPANPVRNTNVYEDNPFFSTPVSAPTSKVRCESTSSVEPDSYPNSPVPTSSPEQTSAPNSPRCKRDLTTDTVNSDTDSVSTQSSFQSANSSTGRGRGRGVPKRRCVSNVALVRDEQGSTDSDAKSTTSSKRGRGRAKLVNSAEKVPEQVVLGRGRGRGGVVIDSRLGSSASQTGSLNLGSRESTSSPDITPRPDTTPRPDAPVYTAAPQIPKRFQDAEDDNPFLAIPTASPISQPVQSSMEGYTVFSVPSKPRDTQRKPKRDYNRAALGSTSSGYQFQTPHFAQKGISKVYLGEVEGAAEVEVPFDWGSFRKENGYDEGETVSAKPVVVTLEMFSDDDLSESD